jgi:phosphoglycolate phosphatase-like HAD superfamily hydrolase
MNKLVLFDIDRTLMIGSKLKDEVAFPEAFKKVYGIDTNVDIINRHGMTDQQIIIEILKKNGLDEKTIHSKLKECMNVMVEIFNKHINHDEFIVLDGVRELLEELDKHNILMGLVTGNLEPIARGSLKKVGLDHYFKVGGFGSDDINRTNLVKLALKRAEENFGFKISNNVFLFGDAPQDMKAGKEAGVKTIGVTTGIYSKEQLQSAGADFVVDSLTRRDEILKIIL